jgi:hypothetical protein
MAKGKSKKQVLPESVINELDGMDEVSLNKTIAASEQAIKTATEERDANPHYQAAKETVKDLGGALKDTKKYQGAKINYALKRLKVLAGEEEAV